MNAQHTMYLDAYSRRMSVRTAATRINRRLLGLFVTLLLLVTSAGLLYLSQACTVAQLRYTIDGNEQQSQELEERITYLRCELAEGESITSLEARVEALGLVDAGPDDVVVVCRTVPAASTAAAATREGQPQALAGLP